PLREMLEQWAAAHGEPAQAVARIAERTASGFREALPRLSQHQWDGLEPLLLIADLMGGDCPVQARRSILTVFLDSLSPEQHDGVQLLADIRDAFGEAYRAS